jgi:methylated-DNA-[protein]-cysteine S-methyltransferase
MTMNHEPDLRQALPAVTEAELAALRDRLPAVTDAELAALRDRLAARADADGVLDVAYRTLDTPVGTLLLAATETGLVRVAYPVEGHDQVLQALAARVSPRILNAPRRLDPAAREIDEYFAGQRHSFDLPLDYRLATGFRREVLGHLPGIGYGTTASYAAVAAATGHPRAFRAVGTACATNPLPVVLPCHRVIKSDGDLGNYRGGPAAKQFLLNLEAA